MMDTQLAFREQQQARSDSSQRKAKPHTEQKHTRTYSERRLAKLDAGSEVNRSIEASAALCTCTCVVWPRCVRTHWPKAVRSELYVSGRREAHSTLLCAQRHKASPRDAAPPSSASSAASATRTVIFSRPCAILA